MVWEILVCKSVFCLYKNERVTMLLLSFKKNTVILANARTQMTVNSDFGCSVKKFKKIDRKQHTFPKTKLNIGNLLGPHVREDDSFFIIDTISPK